MDSEENVSMARASIMPIFTVSEPISRYATQLNVGRFLEEAGVSVIPLVRFGKDPMAHLLMHADDGARERPPSALDATC